MEPKIKFFTSLIFINREVRRGRGGGGGGEREREIDN